jgi:hypothetical protein
MIEILVDRFDGRLTWVHPLYRPRAEFMVEQSTWTGWMTVGLIIEFIARLVTELTTKVVGHKPW